MKKLIIIAIAIIGLAVVFTQCNKKEDNKPVSIAKTQAEKEILKKSVDLINKIEKEDYKNMTDYVYLPEINFITDKDVEWYMPRSILSDLIGSNINVSATSIQETSSSQSLNDQENTFKSIVYTDASDEDKTYELIYVLNRNNEWKMFCEDLYVESINLVCDKGIQLKVNGTDVDSSYITNSYVGTDAPSKNSVVYTIPNVPNKTFPVVLKQGKNEKTVNVTPENNGSSNIILK